MGAVIPRIYRLGAVTCLAVVVMLVACTGGSEPAAPAETVAVGTTTQPANALVPAPTATPVPTAAPMATLVPTTAPTNAPAHARPPTETPVAMPAPTSTPAPALSAESVGVSRGCTRDRDALVELYNATDGDNWRRKDNWLSKQSIASWFGVYADSDGCVDTLTLGNNQLSGAIPPELGNLANLTRLDIGENELSGEIPPELGNLVNLEWLGLYGNQLSGEIPPQLGNLARLELLDFGRNQLSGCVPSGLQGQLGYADLARIHRRSGD